MIPYEEMTDQERRYYDYLVQQNPGREVRIIRSGEAPKRLLWPICNQPEADNCAICQGATPVYA